MFDPKEKRADEAAPEAPESSAEAKEMPDLTKKVEPEAPPAYDFHGYFAEEEEPDSFKKSWRNVWQIILGAYGAFLPLFLTLFVALFLAFLLIRLFLL